MNKISKKLVRNLTKDYLEGVRVVDIARKYNISCPVIYRYTKDIPRRVPYPYKGMTKEKTIKITAKRNKRIYNDLPYANINDLKMCKQGDACLEAWIIVFGLVPAKEIYEMNNYGVTYLNYIHILNKMYYKGKLKKIKFRSKIYYWKQDDYLHEVRDVSS